MPYGIIDPTSAEIIGGGPYGSPLVSGTGKTLAQLRTDLDFALGRRTDLVAADLNKYINDAYIAIVEENDFPELQGELVFSTVAGQSLYRLPQGVETISDASVEDANYLHGGLRLVKTDYSSYRQFANGEGYPSHYFRYQNLLVIWPAPNAVLDISVGFTISPAPLVNDTDIHLLGRGYDRPLVLRAKAMALSDLSEFEEAGAAVNEALGAVRTKISKDAKEQTGRVFGVSVPRKASDLDRRRY